LKNVVGIDIEFPEPIKADIVIDTSDASETPEMSTNRLLDFISQRLP
jgi:adenylylsulfate kinase-like enzyme